MSECSGNVWDRITDQERILLCNYQYDHYKTRLDMFVQSLKPSPSIDHIPEEQRLDKFMAEAPHNQAQVR